MSATDDKYPRSHYYKGIEVAAMFGISSANFSNCVVATPELREIRISCGGGGSRYSKQLLHEWLDKVGGVEAATKMLKKNRAASLLERNRATRAAEKRELYAKKVAQRHDSTRKKEKVINYAIVGEPDGNTLAELMARIASKPTRRYNSEEFGGCT